MSETKFKIVERLNEIADAAMYPADSPYEGDSPFGENIREAASLIQELGEALKPFADITDQVGFDRANGDGCWAAPVKAIRNAHSILSKLKT